MLNCYILNNFLNKVPYDLTFLTKSCWMKRNTVLRIIQNQETEIKSSETIPIRSGYSMRSLIFTWNVNLTKNKSSFWSSVWFLPSSSLTYCVDIIPIWLSVLKCNKAILLSKQHRKYRKLPKWLAVITGLDYFTSLSYCNLVNYNVLLRQTLG